MPDKYEIERMESRKIALQIVYLSNKLDNDKELSPSQIPEMNIERHVLCKVLGYSGWNYFLKYGQDNGFLKVEESDWGINYALF